MQGVWQVVTSRVAAQPANWWKVAEVAELYAQFYRKVSFKRAVNSILSPLGLTDEEFIAKQRIMSPELTRDLTYQLQNFDLGSPVAAIVCGVDISAAHIYVAKNGGVECLDAVGFAAIGVGDWHANSQCMFAKHTRNRTFAETLLLTHFAKKRAEVAPGVGSATDMFAVGPVLGQNVYPIGDHVIQALQTTYDKTNEKAQQSEHEAKTAISDFVAEMGKRAAQAQAPTPPKVADSSPRPRPSPAAP